MMVARVIPCLDVTDGRVVKGINFVDLRDAGDPVELAARYDAEGADELVFLDITASSDGRDTMVDVVYRTAEQVFIPFTVGGGIRSRRRRPADAARRCRQGQRQHRGRAAARADRRDRRRVRRAVRRVRDRRQARGPTGGGFEVYLHGGRTPTGIDALAWATDAAAARRRRDPADVDGSRRHAGGLRPRAHAGGQRCGRRAGDRQRRRRHAAAPRRRRHRRRRRRRARRQSSSTSASTRSPRPRHVMAAAGSRCAARSVPPMTQMEYRRLGRSGIKVSALSFGSWVTFDAQLKDDLAMECMQAAYDAGCNFFDNAEAYAGGESEAIMGRVIAELGWPRLVVRADDEGLLGPQPACPNMQNTLNRKYLMHAIDGSLERFGLDFVDVLYCHRADPDTELEETVWAMSDIISAGKALLLGHVGVGGRRDPRRHRDRRAPPPAQAGHRAVAVQPPRRGRGRAGVRAAVRRDRLRRDDLEPAGVGPADRQVPRRHPRRLAWRGARLRLAGVAAVRCGHAGQGRAAAADRRRARLLDGPAGAGVVPDEPERVDRDHRGQQGQPGRRQLRRDGRLPPPRRPTSSPASTPRWRRHGLPSPSTLCTCGRNSAAMCKQLADPATHRRRSSSVRRRVTSSASM